MARTHINQGKFTGQVNLSRVKLDNPHLYRVLGRQGILYEYVVPYGKSVKEYYKNAIDVRSIKRSEKYDNGKRIGQYQPIGDKRYFTFYQLKQMRRDGRDEEYMQQIIDMLARFYMQSMEQAIVDEVLND